MVSNSGDRYKICSRKADDGRDIPNTLGSKGVVISIETNRFDVFLVHKNTMIPLWEDTKKGAIEIKLDGWKIDSFIYFNINTPSLLEEKKELLFN